MREYILRQRTYIKSSNNVRKMYRDYSISLIIFSILIILINLFLNQKLAFTLTKSLLLSTVITTVISYIINIIKKEYNFLKLFKEDNIEQIAIILGLFAVNTNILVLTLAIIITLIIKTIFKKISISSTLYGILVIAIYKYYLSDIITPLITIKNMEYSITLDEIIELGGGIKNYLFGIEYLSPILSIIAFLYLFHKKVSKYSLIFSYTTTFLFTMTIFGVLNDASLWFGVFELLSGGTIFLIVYTLADYKITPTISEGNIIYGIILAILSSILRIVIPELALPLLFIIAPLVLTKYIDNISPKLKYNKKLFISCTVALSIIALISTVILYKIF